MDKSNKSKHAGNQSLRKDFNFALSYSNRLLHKSVLIISRTVENANICLL